MQHEGTSGAFGEEGRTVELPEIPKQWNVDGHNPALKLVFTTEFQGFAEGSQIVHNPHPPKRARLPDQWLLHASVVLFA